MRVRRYGGGAAALLTVAVLTGCAGTPAALPTIGAPAPTSSAVASPSNGAESLAQEWDLRGAALPADWPDIPLPAGTDVITAYAIDSEPQRTWTATFASDRGTAIDLAEPVVEELRKRGFAPVAQYVGGAATNTGLYSFAGPGIAVYVVLGEDDGRPNVVITARGSSQPSALPTPGWKPPAPTGTPTPTTEGIPSPSPESSASSPSRASSADVPGDESDPGSEGSASAESTPRSS